MKKFIFYIMTAVFTAAVCASCENNEPGGGLSKAVSVGEQNGEMIAGEERVISFSVAVTNIANGRYSVAVNNLPEGVQAASGVTIDSGEGTLTLEGGYFAKSGIYALTLTISGAVSEPFTLTIEPNPLGDGSEENPWKVATADDLQKIDNAYGWTLTAHYIQTADINMSGVSNHTPIGTGFPNFAGSYNGAGYAILNLKIVTEGRDNTGMFGVNAGEVRNLALINPYVSGDGEFTGIFAGLNYGVIENCYIANGYLYGDISTGGLTGGNFDGTIRNCYCDCREIHGNSKVGGIAGENRGVIRNTYITGGEVKGQSEIGGIAGFNRYGTIANCVALFANFRIPTGLNSNVGRITGTIETGSEISNNYARESGMTLPDGYILFLSPNHNDGANVSATDYNGANSNAWWGGTAQFPSDAWTFAAHQLPHLKGFNGVQNPTVN